MATKAELKKLEEALKNTQDKLAQVTGDAPIPGFKPSVKMPTPAKQPGQSGFVGPVAPAETQFIFDQQGNPVEVYTTGPKAGTSVETGFVVFQGSGPTKTTNTGGTPTGGTGTGTGGKDGKDVIVPNSEMSDAYQRLYDEFSALGLGALVEDGKNLLMKATSISQMPEALRNTTAYMTRFSANDARIKAGFKALSPAAYLALEDQYQNVMREYGLPASYYTPGLYGKQEGFEKLIASDVSNTELEDRLMAGQDRVVNANPEVAKALKQFYPDITNGDILAYVINPENAIKDIQRKVTAAEIGGAQLGAGLQATVSNAETLAKAGVTGQQYQARATNIAESTLRGGQLAAIYGQGPYTQQMAEQVQLDTPGSVESLKKTKKITGLERASFGGQTGLTSGALARDRAGGI
jgi:hypothetical protein